MKQKFMHAAQRTGLTAILSIGLGIGVAAAATNRPQFEVADKYALQGADRWDYVAYDAPRHHLFISRADHVQVIDTRTGTLTGEIANTAGVHGFAFVPERNLGFITDGRANTITVVKLDSLQVVDTIRAGGADPDGILYVPILHRVYISNGHDNSVSAIDVDTLKLVATIPVGGKPEALAADAQGRVFVNIEDRREVAVLDGNRNVSLTHWSVASCEDPSGLAIDPIRARLFTVCANRRMLVLDTQSGHQIATVPIGDGPDAAAFDPTLKIVFSSNGVDGTLSAVHEDDADHFSVLQNLPTQTGARTMALDVQTHTLYLVSSKFGPPDSAASQSHHEHGSVVPGTFVVLVVKPTQTPAGG